MIYDIDIWNRWMKSLSHANRFDGATNILMNSIAADSTLGEGAEKVFDAEDVEDGHWFCLRRTTRTSLETSEGALLTAVVANEDGTMKPSRGDPTSRSGAKEEGTVSGVEV